ncbi:MAG: hypothetical protein K2H64_01235 [Desulfovibrio sp.]|nr:hypothetical protein [Desulfovibrio sp.]
MYAEWEMACCGNPFAVGQRIEWPVARMPPQAGESQAERGFKLVEPYWRTD